MQIWECVDPVNYGRIDFSPDAIEEEKRVIKLPDRIEPDAIIKAHFKLRPEAVKEEALIDVIETVTETIPPTETTPDLLKKFERESLEDKQTKIKEQFKKRR